MKEQNPQRKLMWMIGGVAVLLVLMLVAPKLKPSSGGDPGTDEPSIVTTTGSNTNTNTNTNDVFATNGPANDGANTGASSSASSSASDALAAAQDGSAADTAAFTLGGGEVFSLMWRLALVLAVLAACIVGLRWWSKRAAGPRSTTGYLRIVDTLPIQGGRSVHLVAVGERVIVVGATAQQLSYLAELGEEDATSLLTERDSAPQPSVSAFAAQLFQSLRREEAARPANRNAQVIGEYE